MCGLAGFSGASAPNLQKIMLLGAMCTTRGTDSCGMFYSEHVHHGIGTQSNFINFLKNNPIDFSNLRHNTVFIHTRRASFGSPHTAKNAHPFSYPLGKPTFNFLLMHNGVIGDLYNLAKKYGYNNFHSNFDVDTQLLGDIIFKGDLSVLSYYEGDAALAFTHTKDLDTIYLWKGAHKVGNDKEMTVERDLHYVFDDNGMYFASEYEALACISDETIREVPNNTLLTITKGVIVDKKRIKRYYHERKPAPQKQYTDWEETDTPSKDSSPKKDNLTAAIIAKCKAKIYWMDGLYYRNGHVLNGIHMVQSNGEIGGSTKYYFYHGLLAKDAKSYEAMFEDNMISAYTIVQGTMSNNVIDLVHPSSLVKVFKKYKDVITNKYAQGDYQPIFSILKMNLKDGEVMMSTITAISSYLDNNLTYIEEDAEFVEQLEMSFDLAAREEKKLTSDDEEVVKALLSETDSTFRTVKDDVQLAASHLLQFCSENGTGVPLEVQKKVTKLKEAFNILENG